MNNNEFSYISGGESIQNLNPKSRSEAKLPEMLFPMFPAYAQPIYAEPMPVPMQPAYVPPATYSHNTYYLSPGPIAKRNLFSAYWRKVGGGSFILSLLIHAGILIAAYFVVETIVKEEKVDFLSGTVNLQRQEATQQLAYQSLEKKRSKIDNQTPLKRLVSKSTTAGIALPDIPIETIELPETSTLMKVQNTSGGFGGGFSAIGGAPRTINNLLNVFKGNPINALPPTLRSRCDKTERLLKLKENGGLPECENAVNAALAYLKTKQNYDGSWGSTNKGAMTGLALLCYFGRCETPDSSIYGDTVMKGIMYLIELQKKNPYKLFSEASTGNGSVYEHGIATYALGEMYILARMGNKSLPGMREAFEEGVKVIIESQRKTGGWCYNTELGIYGDNRDDLSVTGWQYQALKAAKLTSLKIEGLHSSVSKVIDYIDSVKTVDGGYGTTNREASYHQWGLTGAGVLGLQMLASNKSADAKSGVKFAHEMFLKEPPKYSDNFRHLLYSWYYYSQIFFQSGGEEWQYWNDTAQPEILKNQSKDGSWTHSSAMQGGDKIQATAFCTLMLEVYYRYLKVGDKGQKSIFDK